MLAEAGRCSGLDQPGEAHSSLAIRSDQSVDTIQVSLRRPGFLRRLLQHPMQCVLLQPPCAFFSP